MLNVGATEAIIGAPETVGIDYYDDTQAGTFNFLNYTTTVVSATTGISYAWGATPPLAGMGDAPWALRWNQWVSVTQAGLYTVTAIADDGVGVSIAGVSVIYSLSIRDTAPLTAGIGVSMAPGNLYQLQVSYLNYTSTNGASFRLLWTRPDGVTEEIPAAALRARGRRDYYSFGGAMVAMRTTATATLTYLHGDHLGSASLTTNASGQKVSEQRYKPGACPERQRRGEVRWSSGAGMPTDPSTDRITGPLRAGFTFTSQRAGSYGTFFMSAREYLPSLGRFLSADSIVPGAGNPQALNRYAYVFNSPLRYVDPSGHDPLDQAWLDAFRAAHGRDPSDEDRQVRLYTLTRRGPISGGVDWSAADWAEFGRQGRNYWFGRLEAEMTRRSLSDFVGEIRNLARYYVSTETDSFVSAIALLYAGIPYDNRGGQVVAQGFGNGARIAVSTCPAGAITCLWLDHGSYGFGRHVTNNDREENTHHYAGHLLAGYWLGTAVNTVGAFIREIGEGLREGHGLDTADTQMAEVAGRHGAMLRGALVDIDPSRRQISPADLAALISVDLSPR